ncbi:DUF3137 domain-containing protein [Tropicibacter oceani]|uniref:DUF3137 domain-containing protein n=1 Tax=Tropicibacter oceani TaxID=3058420 RepID=A0ABY8QHU5_9RHOB|nr:DUF3137 domain-containing protein [Tropicibacter oceani]WGW04185.1 DUF3137 domain-containing protein [Tropicibacter oceani]
MDFKETQPIETGFAPVFASKIAPHMGGLEDQRKTLQGKGARMFKIALGLGAVLGGGVIAYTGASAGGILGGIAVFVLFLIGGAIARGSQSARYTGALSDLVMPVVCDFLGDTQYDPRPGQMFQPEALSTMGLVDLHDQGNYEDRISGTYRGLGFELAETRLTQEVKEAQGKTSTKEVFDGLLIRIGLPMHATTDILVTRNMGQVGGAVLGFLAGDTGRGMPEVDTGHPPFDAAYALHAKDPQAALTLMKPPLLQALMDVGAQESETGAEGFRAAFEGSNLWLALPRSARFMEFGSIDAEAGAVAEELHGVFADMALIRRVIDRLLDD